MCIVVFIFIILAVFILTPTLESFITGPLKSKWVDLHGDHRVEMWDDEKAEQYLKTKKGNQLPPLIFKKGEEEKWDFERDVKRAETPSDTFGGEKPLVISVPKKDSLKSVVPGFGAAAMYGPTDGY